MGLVLITYVAGNGRSREGAEQCLHDHALLATIPNMTLDLSLRDFNSQFTSFAKLGHQELNALVKALIAMLMGHTVIEDTSEDDENEDEKEVPTLGDEEVN